MLMHDQPIASVHSLQAQREASAAHKRPAPDGSELERLLRSAARRDNDAWRQLVERFGPRIRSVARYEGLSPRDAEDVVQSTWLELLKSTGTVRDPAKLGAWLYTTARRESLRVAIAGRRAKPVEEEVLVNAQVTGDLTPLAAPEASGRLEAEQRRAALTRALGTLTPRQRELMHMLMIDPAPSYAEISVKLDMPVGSIGPTRARCLERLRGDPALINALAA
jgi:RNA polymerase sigma factor (sigma-70 family)